MDKNRFVLCLTAGLLFTAAGAFAQEPAPPAAPGEEKAKSDEVLTMEPVPGPYQYNSGGRKDPFESLLILKSIEVDLSRLPEIQRLEVSALRIKGVLIAASKAPEAMLLDPATNKYYYVKPGDLIGRNQGVVVEVTGDRVVIQEKFKDFLGKVTTKDVVINVSQPITVEPKGGKK